MNRYSSYTDNRNNDINNNNMDEADSLLLISPIAKVRQSNMKIQSIGRGMMINRIILIVLVVLFLLYSLLYTQSQISQITIRIEDITDRINAIETIQTQHTLVIERFNSSITNTDIVDQLRSLEYNISRTTHMLHNELKYTKQDIDTELTSTIHQLNKTVSAAEQEIYDQVTRVKKDVEQYVITTQDQFSMENSFMVYQLAGTFTVLSCLISMWHMTGHLRKLHQPNIQRKILAILWMSPIYAITSWFSLVFHSASGYLAILKDFYEAYVIYQFLSFCIAVIGKGDRNVVVDLLAQDSNIQHLTPPIRFFTCCELLSCGRCCIAPKYESSKQLADAILLQCQVFAIQFVFFRPVTTTAMVVMEQMNYHGPIFVSNEFLANNNNINPALNHLFTPQFYISIIQNISIFVAFTGLLKFYHAVDHELAWCRPLAKFLCIKGVVFMTFWQGVILSILAQTTDLGNGSSSNNSNNNDDASVEWAKSAQNFLICLEMLLFSIAHFYCFPTEEWEDGYRMKHSNGSSTFSDSIALGDFFADLKLILKTNSSTKKKRNSSKQKKFTSNKKVDPTIPEGDDEIDDAFDDNETSDMISTTSSITNNNNNNHNIGYDDHDDNDIEHDGDGDVDVDDHHHDVHDNGIDQTTTVTSASTPKSLKVIDTRQVDYDDNDDDGNITNHQTMMIARALQESLGELADDPDIAEATKRLLDSKILSPSFFEYNNQNIDNQYLDHYEKYDMNSNNKTFANSDSTPNKISSRIDTNNNNIDTMDALISEFISSPPSEHTKLLTLEQQQHHQSHPTTTTTPSSSSLSSSFVETTTPSLRPSIFTTIASIAESEDDVRKQE